MLDSPNWFMVVVLGLAGAIMMAMFIAKSVQPDEDKVPLSVCQTAMGEVRGQVTFYATRWTIDATNGQRVSGVGPIICVDVKETR